MYGEIEFYKCMLRWQTRATEIALKNTPQDMGNGKIGYPVDDGGYQKCLDNIQVLKSALSLLQLTDTPKSN